MDLSRIYLAVVGTVYKKSLENEKDRKYASTEFISTHFGVGRGSSSFQSYTLRSTTFTYL